MFYDLNLNVFEFEFGGVCGFGGGGHILLYFIISYRVVEIMS
jgi:hypothetical protein